MLLFSFLIKYLHEYPSIREKVGKFIKTNSF